MRVLIEKESGLSTKSYESGDINRFMELKNYIFVNGASGIGKTTLANGLPGEN